MAIRQVTATGKDSEGDMTKLCGDFGSSTKQQAIDDSESGAHEYRSGGSLVEVVHDSSVSGGKYLRTKPNGGTANNLDNLPDC